MPSIFDSKEEGPYDNLGMNEVIELLKGGADLEATDKYFRTPLINAAYWGNQNYVEEILALGANINAVGQGDYTALSYAAINKNADLCKFLIDAGADVTVPSYEGENALSLAAASGLTEICLSIIDKGLLDVNCINKSWHGGHDKGATPLMYAAKGPSTGANCSSQPDTCKALIAAGADVSMKDELGQTALYKAVCNDRPGADETVRILLEAGADAAAVSAFGTNVLWRAAYSGMVDVCKLLVEKGADALIAGERGECNNALREMGVEFVHGGRSGIEVPYTTLMLAVSEACEAANRDSEYQYEDSVKMCKVLVEAGVDVDKNTEKGTAWSIAKAWGNEEVVNMLEELGAKKQ